MGHEADGVFQGGGAKGLALTGALSEFADAKQHPADYVDTWVQLAGTSAGAIVAAYLACGHTAAETAALAQATDFQQFEDWGAGGELLGGAKNLAHVHGLAHGEVFRKWFAKQTGEKTFGEITRDGRTLKLIATDITRREMLVLPDALTSYSLKKGGEPIDAASFLIADAVRMSMSIPYFFQPVELFHHETGARSTIVDGGVLSNFPVWIFDVADRDPLRPTFGFKLVGGRAFGSGLSKVVNLLGWPVEMGVDIFHTATEAWDKYWVSRATYVRTCTISAGEVGTTDFNLTDAQKRGLLESGRQAARAFLGRWRPGDYVNSAGRKLATAGEPAAPAA
ncbi:MAG TPA: patatin-like phospholipase family protein [Solirubrobacteraceae bacterium]|nr:patatin-like phospholipase family protein [Solirubrobacteraceae bacterium]